MRIRLLAVGKIKDEHMRALACDYLKRLSRFTRCEVTEVKPGRDSGTREGIEEEGERISGALDGTGIAVTLDEKGEQWGSRELADMLEEWQSRGVKEVAFVIGGPGGLSGAVKARSAHQWSLSRLTLQHDMARVLVAEQIYRAFTIIHGLPYQK